jgi:hypothetical protein
MHTRTYTHMHRHTYTHIHTHAQTDACAQTRGGNDVHSGCSMSGRIRPRRSAIPMACGGDSMSSVRRAWAFVLMHACVCVCVSVCVFVCVQGGCARVPRRAGRHSTRWCPNRTQVRAQSSSSWRAPPPPSGSAGPAGGRRASPHNQAAGASATPACLRDPNKRREPGPAGGHTPSA